MTAPFQTLINHLKPFVDRLATQCQRWEETRYPQATLLHGFPRLLQLDGHSCGVQCASMILRYFRKDMPIEKIAAALSLTKNGVSLQELKRFFRNQGLAVKTIGRCYPKKLRQAIARKSPVILSMDQDHWVTVYGYSGDTFFVADPALPRSLFSAHPAVRFRERRNHDGLIISKRATGGIS